jgi:hypothetical protein
MVRARGEEFVGYFTGWTYSAPRAFGWITDYDKVQNIEDDPLAIRVVAELAQLRVDGLLPVGPRGVGYILLGRTVNGRTVVKDKGDLIAPGEDAAATPQERKAIRRAYLADFYDFADIGDTLVALRRARLVSMDDVLDGRTENHNPLVALNANQVRRTLEAWSKRFRPNVLNDQNVYTEWWCEAQGLARAVANLLTPYGISVYSGSGDNPVPAVAACAERLQVAREADKDVVVCIIGDYDVDGRENADRFVQDVEAFLSEDGYDGQVEWRWVAPLPAHITRWPDLAAAQEPGKSKGVKSLPWTMQGEALLRGGVLATIVTEEAEDILDMEQYEDTLGVWQTLHSTTILKHTGTKWESADEIAEHLTNVLLAAWWAPATLDGGTPPE